MEDLFALKTSKLRAGKLDPAVTDPDVRSAFHSVLDPILGKFGDFPGPEIY